MRTRHLASILALIVIGACSGNSLTGPQGNGDPYVPPALPAPDQSRFLLLPLTQRLVDVPTLTAEREGKETTFWATLHDVRPLRGSPVVNNDYHCPSPQAGANACFSIDLELGFGPLSNPHIVAAWEVYLSVDGESIWQRVGAYNPHKMTLYGFTFTEVPKYLVVKGSHNGSQYDKIFPEKGRTSFLIDYVRAP